MLRCRVCQRQWKLPTGSVPRCIPFLHGECELEGAQCPYLHVFKRKECLDDRVKRFGDALLVSAEPSPKNSAPHSPNSAQGTPRSSTSRRDSHVLSPYCFPVSEAPSQLVSPSAPQLLSPLPCEARPQWEVPSMPTMVPPQVFTHQPYLLHHPHVLSLYDEASAGAPPFPSVSAPPMVPTPECMTPEPTACNTSSWSPCSGEDADCIAVIDVSDSEDSSVFTRASSSLSSVELQASFARHTYSRSSRRRSASAPPALRV